MNTQNCLIYCSCGAEIISDDKKQTLSDSFKNLNIDVFELNDICAFAVHEKDFLNDLEKKYNKKYIVACYPRAVQNIFSQNQIELSNYEVLNFRETKTEVLIELMEEKTDGHSGNFKYQYIQSELDVPAWYPIIDKSRCTLCGQCARFCLFGVYKFDKKSLKVVNPLSCKNNCPACGRTCPASAIIFPKLAENSSLSGADAVQSKKAPENQGLFVRLNERNSVRKDIFRSGLMKQAEEERQKALEELKKGFVKKE